MKRPSFTFLRRYSRSYLHPQLFIPLFPQAQEGALISFFRYPLHLCSGSYSLLIICKDISLPTTSFLSQVFNLFIIMSLPRVAESTLSHDFSIIYKRMPSSIFTSGPHHSRVSNICQSLSICKSVSYRNYNMSKTKLFIFFLKPIPPLSSISGTGPVHPVLKSET